MSKKRRGTGKSSDRSGSSGGKEKSDGQVRNGTHKVIDHHPPPKSKPKKSK